MTVILGSFLVSYGICTHKYMYFLRARSLVVSDLRSETKDFWFESGCYLCAEVSSLQCLWSGWKRYWGVKEMPSPLPYSPVIPECSWKKTQIEKENLNKLVRLWQVKGKALINYLSLKSEKAFPKIITRIVNKRLQLSGFESLFNQLIHKNIK